MAAEESGEEKLVGEEEIREVKRIRKKLRQIEKLERLNRNLNDDEENKLSKKFELRELLVQLMAELRDKGIDHSINKSASTINDSGMSSPNGETETINNKSATINSESFTPDEPITSPIENPSEGIATPPPLLVSSTPNRVIGNSSQNKWAESCAVVTPLEGHEEVVCAVDCNHGILMTGSRDTTVKVWSLHDLRELRSLGFHKAAVTCVKILPQNDEMLTSIPEEERNNCSFGISGSLDCYIAFWNLETGQLVHKVYTFSSIQCFVYHEKHVYTGSDGGKVDMWRLTDGHNVSTLSRSGCGITCMALSGVWLLCGRTRGSIQVWNIETREMCFDWRGSSSLEDDVTSSRCIRCICYYDNKIYWGDDGTNLKVLEWNEGSDRCGRLIKLTNHFHEFGSSGGVAICPRMGLLLCAGYDLDTGHSMINVRSLSMDNNYLCTIQDDHTPYISCMCVVSGEGAGQGVGGACVRIVTGGGELNVIDVYHSKNRKLNNSSTQWTTQCHFNDKLTRSYSTDDDSDCSLVESDPTRTVLHEKPLPRRRNTGVVPQDEVSWLWWLYGKCTIL